MLRSCFCWLLLYFVAAVHAVPDVPVAPDGPFSLHTIKDEYFSPPPDPEPDPVEGDLFQGDIKNAGRKIGQAGTAQKPWPNGVIPYRFDCSVENIPSAMSATREAIKEWESRTCIRFVEKRPEDRAFLEFFRSAGCWATYVGYRKNTKTQVSIGYGCDYKHVMVHELGHVIGFWHEQSRKDRDSYIYINFNNVLPALRYNFDIVKEQTNSFGEPYDYASIMHYPWNAFAINRRRKTIVPKRPLNGKVPYVKLSHSDVAQAKKMYKCDAINAGRATVRKSMNTGKISVGSAISKRSQCLDDLDGCTFWAKLGNCDLHPDPMLSHCQKSCRNCGPCVDYNENCPAWASYGLCLTATYYMYKNCKKSCRICREEPAPTTAPTTRPRPRPRPRPKPPQKKPTTKHTIRIPSRKFTGVKCVDRSKHCHAWMRNGRCKTDQWVYRNCMVSCKRYDVCDADPVKPVGRCTSSFNIGWSKNGDEHEDRYFTATSAYSPGGGWYAGAANARLYKDDDHTRKRIGAWCADPRRKSDEEYLEINFGRRKRVTAVATQGRDRYFEHVKSYYLKFSSDKRAWFEYRENGARKIFEGNCDHFTPVMNALTNRPVARHIRFYPIKYIGAKCLRVEVYGCDA